MSLPEPLQEVLEQLVGDLDLGAVGSVERLTGGRNNRVFRVDTGKRPLLLKHYYRDAYDPRDRLAADFGFSRFAWERGVRCIPEPLAAAPLFGMALYELVEGRQIGAADVTTERVDQALDFLVSLNQHRETPAASALPFASEACFTVADHLDTIAARVGRLVRASIEDARGAAVVTRLAQAWDRVRTHAEGGVGLPSCRRGERCLSPSDFGFHNALLRADGRLLFHDFEYAGWDDPAKLTCDFVLQVEMPLAPQSIEPAIARLSQGMGLPPSYGERVHVLLSAYRVKWCCIILNDLLPEAAERRRFAAAGVPSSEHESTRLGQQIERAERLVAEIEAGLDGLH